ncbi:hypothetical protein [Paenibacillus xylanexedens]|uniref:hypothetical protein n=1 Tax=Paenibacillus xylanexedens TaxID=528191 RepID=UPI003D05BC28
MLKKVLSSLALSAVLLGSTSLAANAAEIVTPTPAHDAINANATPVDGVSLPLHQFYSPFASSEKTLTTTTGGKLTSNVWLDSQHSGGLIDYQVSAVYNKTDHTNIKSTWYATIYSRSTSQTASVTVNTNGTASVSASTTTSTTAATTAAKYIENTQGQSSASYRSNLAVQGDWKEVYLTNTASVWGNKYGSIPASYSAQTSVSK